MIKKDWNNIISFENKKYFEKIKNYLIIIQKNYKFPKNRKKHKLIIKKLEKTYIKLFYKYFYFLKTENNKINI